MTHQPIRFNMQRIFLILVTLILIGAACSLPSQSQPDEEIPASEASIDAKAPSPSPTLPPPPTPTPQPLPPTLVESDPPPGVAIPLQGALTFYFNQSMDRGSVEGAIVGQPELSGRLNWLDDATLVFEPDTAFPADSQLVVEVGTAARATNGLAMLEPVRLSYHTASPLRAVQMLPAPGVVEADPASAIVATFDQPVVPLGADPATLPVAFGLNPTISGSGEWVNTSTFIFYPDPPLHGGITYEVTLNQELRSTIGGPLEGMVDSPGVFTWSFSTAIPKLLSVSPEADAIFVPLDTSIELTFNQAMDSASVEGNFAILDPEGSALPGIFSWNEDFSTMVFTPTNLLVREKTYSIVLLGTAESRGGTPLGSEYRQQVTTVPSFAVIQTDPLPGERISMHSYLSVEFSAPLDPQLDPLGYVSISPPVANLGSWLNSDGRTLNISGSFEPENEYRLTISGSLTDRWGQGLGQDYALRFFTESLRPTLQAAQFGSQIFITPKDISISAKATNINSVDLSLGSVPIADMWPLLGTNGYENIQNYWPADAQSWTEKVEVSSSQISTIQLPLTPNERTLLPGLYHYRVNAIETPGPSGPYLIVNSYVHLTFKLSATQVFVWALDLRNNNPVSNATINIYDEVGNFVAGGSTDQEGIFQSSIHARPDVFGNYYAIMGEPGDDNFAFTNSAWDTGLSGSNFGISTDYSGPHTEAYIYTDRSIYRPGQTVNFRAVVRHARNGRYTLPDIGILPLSILDGNYQPVLEMELQLSEYGTAHGQFTLADEAPPGYYQIETPYGLVSFKVAEYRKPEIDLQITANPDPALAGETINVQVEARYYFDAPAGDVPLTWSVSTLPVYFPLPGFTTGADDFGWMLPYWMISFYGYGERISSGEGKTGPDGLLTIEIPTTPEEVTNRYTIEVTLQDESGFPVSNRTEVIVHPAEFYIGVRTDTWVGRAEEEISFDVKVVDWDRNPAGSRDLFANFRRVTWELDETSSLYDLPSYTPRYTPVSSANFQTGSDGLARLVFTPPEPGTYELAISGDGALTQLIVWVGGPGQVTWPNMPNQRIQLTPDQETYIPGDTAKVFIPNPLGEDTQALVTIERGEVLRYETLTINESGYTLELLLTGDDAPNVYLAVTLIGSENDGLYDFRQGYVNLAVEPLEQTLNVTLTPLPAGASPQDEVSFTVRVTDAEGNPIQGEFSLGIVDKAVLALAGPFEAGIVEAFYGTQPLGVRTGLSLAAYAHRFTVQPGGKGGGGGDAIPLTVREEFPDTAYWNAEILTDANGQAQITLQLPDNLTTWQATTRGLTVDTKVGEAEAELVSTKDVLIRPVTPRFMVVGDYVRLMGIVHNNTDSDLNLDVTLQTTGFSLDDPANANKSISVPAGGRVPVEWWGTVEDVPAVDLVFSTQGEGYSDATRPVWGELPVLRNIAPQTFGTAGTLEEGGKRLEIVSLPRTYDPGGGDLRVELAPSLAAAMLPGLDVLEHYPYECTEQTLSRFLPNLEAYRAVQELGLTAPDLEARLERTLNEGIQRLVARQNPDGGWGWWSAPSLAGNISDAYITAYVLFGLSRARDVGAFVDEGVIQNAANFLISTLPAPEMLSDPWQLDRLAFQHFALAQAGSGSPSGLGALYEARSQLSPWAQAFLALTLETLSPGDPRIRELYSDLEATAIRTATGTHWVGNGAKLNMETPVFTTAVVVYALAQYDPASATIPEAVRYLMAARGTEGAWASTYETAWAVMGLTEVMKGTGELAGDFGFGAALNGVDLVSGTAGGDARLNPVSASVPVSSLYPQDPNALTIQRGAGPGRLYYTAHLNVLRPVEEVTPLDRGISISRSFETIEGKSMTDDSGTQSSVGEVVVVRVALTLKNTAYYLVVEDYIPAGAEILDTSLKTSQQVNVDYDPRDPFGSGWGWWYFNDPQIYDERIAWSVNYLPAGTYELTYALVLNQPGEYRVLPAHAWEFYFPEVQGNGAGDIFRIEE